MRTSPGQPASRSERPPRAVAALLAALLAPAVATAATPAGAPRVRIELRAESEVAGAVVHLGEVAALDTTDAPTLERLASLPLGPAPRIGTVVRLERVPLARWIRARTGLREDQIRWAGADATAVRVAIDTVPSGAIVDAARGALREVVAELGVTAEPSAAQVPLDLGVPAGRLELRARAVPRVALRSRRPAVWVDVRVDGRLVRAVPVIFELSGDPADARRGGATAADGGALDLHEVLPRAEVPPPAATAPQRADPAVLVRRGSWATLRASRGLVSIESKVEVLEDGRPGQSVHVRAARAEGPVLARVAGPGALEVVP